MDVQCTLGFLCCLFKCVLSVVIDLIIRSSEAFEVCLGNSLSVGNFHRAYNLRPVYGWLSCTYGIGVTCLTCGRRRENDLCNDNVIMGYDVYNLLLECENCFKCPTGNVKIDSSFNGPEWINQEGIAVTVMKVKLEGLYLRLESDVDLASIKWTCNLEKKNEPGATVVRRFYLENNGFYERSRWDEERDSDDEGSDDTDSEDSDSDDAWDSDDSDRPCIRNVTASLDYVGRSP